MRIIQFTDIHIGDRNESLHGVNVRNNFVKVIRAIAAEKKDLVVLSGDLCASHPQPGIYQWIKETLHENPLCSELSIISGNHDNTQLLSQEFKLNHLLNNSELYYCKSNDYVTIFYLDTSIGECSPAQKEWLEEGIRKSTNKVVIFMHHPPFLCGVRFMDNNYSLKDRQDFQSIFKRYRNKSISIFCGHYHVEKSLVFQNVQLFLTPSCFVQIDQESPNFAPDHYMIGYRIIEIAENGQVMTSVKYLDA